MTTTYVVGAGASLHVGYPLAATMGETLLDFMSRYPTPPPIGQSSPPMPCRYKFITQSRATLSTSSFPESALTSDTSSGCGRVHSAG
jgi:hypothetical protein